MRRRGGGKGDKGMGWREGGKVTEGMGGAGQDMEEGKEEGEVMGAEYRLQPPNFNSWRRYCMKGIRAPASHLIWTPIS